MRTCITFLWLLLCAWPLAAAPPPGCGLPGDGPPREMRQRARRQAWHQRQFNAHPLPADLKARAAERLRLETEVRELRLRLEEAGNSEAIRQRPTWWDLPSRRRQAESLRYLRHLRRELDFRLERLEELRQDAPLPTH